MVDDYEYKQQMQKKIDVAQSMILNQKRRIDELQRCLRAVRDALVDVQYPEDDD